MYKSVPDRAHALLLRENSVTVIRGGKEQMKRLKLLSLVAGLAVGNLVGCSRPSTKLPERQMASAPGRELTDGREETGPGTTKSKRTIRLGRAREERAISN